MQPDTAVPPDIASYIADCPRIIRARMRKMRTMILRAAPGAEESISYRMPAFKLHGALVYFAAFKRHIGFYPGPEALRKFGGELASYEKSNGTVRFAFDQPVPYGAITRIVKFRVKENLARAAAKQKRKRRARLSPRRRPSSGTASISG